MPPKISICLPNLNNRRFMEDRLRSIYAQTLADWELVVVDSFSDDGAWELLQEHAAREPRIRLTQSPREGPYPAWNQCVQLARGEYIYFATSDDTMSPDCLRLLAQALDAHPDVSLATCGLDIIDEESRVLPGAWERIRQTRYYRPWLDRLHRRAGFTDFCWTITLEGVPHISITALLIRRSLFAQAGYFPVDVGFSGDREWYWKASLYSDIVHVPQHLATWRIWRNQSVVRPVSRAVYLNYFEKSVDQIFTQHQARLAELCPVPLARLREFFREEPYYARRELIRGFDKTRAQKLALFLGLALANPQRVAREFWDRLCGIDDYSQTYRFRRVEEISRWLRLAPPVPLDPS